ncbi:MAG TPA: hypothetical protein VHX16_18620, partial [Chloroflexota bacterium]|nr:hypothetical protein [Chloroflexota bacterium]
MIKRASVAGGFVLLASTLSLSAGVALAQQSVEISMSPQNGSGQSGKTTLYAEGDKTRVVVMLDNPVPGAEPAHIHLGSCPVPD